MNDFEFNTQLKRVQERTNVWVDNLRLWNWEIRYHFYRGPIDGRENFQAIACAEVRWEYGEADISWNLMKVKDLSDEELEKCVVHEYLHLLVNEMQHLSDDYAKHEEHVVSMITLAIMHTRNSERVQEDELE